uniref:Selenocysteine-specific elongation factor n=1 Tax=Homalodisca liturata TaxID=320908 RepID=A0A1B6IRP7_9HEMI
MDTLNINIGVLGHVDSGKTSLTKVLSSTTSTACFDKNPQSQERGITIDLGFSSLAIDFPKTINIQSDKPYSKLQYTFVDCPGHASLIRTIIGGAQIIDLMLLVVDITKGIQTQTAECLVIGEILCPKMIVVLNKIYQIEESKRQQVIEKMKKKIKLTLSKTIFGDSPVVSVAANPGNSPALGIAELLEVLESHVYLPQRHPEKPAVFSVDHCFSIRGQGTVMTGTLWQGTIRVNDVIEIPSLSLTKKVKSIQIYRKNVEKGEAGDRMAVCVTQFDPKLLERGIVSTPGLISHVYAAITSIHKVKYYKQAIGSNSKFHISIGHETVIGKLTIFGPPDSLNKSPFNMEEEYLYRSSLFDPSFDEANKNENDEELFALLEFEKPILIVPESLYISSKLDMDIHTNNCRIAFYGRIVEAFSDKTYHQTVLPKLKIYKNKSKSGVVDRIVNEYEVVCKDMFKKETRLDLFTGLRVSLSSGENGVIEGCFGQSGKIRVRIPQGLKPDTVSKFGSKKSRKGKTEDEETSVRESLKVELKFKTYVFSENKKIVQGKEDLSFVY